MVDDKLRLSACETQLGAARGASTLAWITRVLAPPDPEISTAAKAIRTAATPASARPARPWSQVRA